VVFELFFSYLPYLRESNVHLNFQNLETKKVFVGECNPEFLRNFIEFYQILRILWTTRQFVMNDKATYMWLGGQV
jgi:hypothetical protein